MGRDGDRTEVWLDLLRTLTERHHDWLVLKHPQSAFVGDGDIDSAAPRAGWPSIADIFRAWAQNHGLRTVIECPHAPGWLHLVALDDSGGRFWELDVNERKYFRGSLFYTANQLLELATMDSRGFRRLRPGAEGLIKLLHNGTRRGGRRNPEGLSTKGVTALLEADPEGAMLAARLCGSAGPSALRGVRACVAGGWDRRAMLAVEARFSVRAIGQPRGLAWRLTGRRARRVDPLLEAVFAGSRHPIGRQDVWLDRVRRDHRVDET